MKRQCPADRRSAGPGLPSVTILHRLPGRIRLQLVPAPRDPARLSTAVGGHAGVELVRYSAPTRTVLVRYQTHHVRTEELVLRLALAHSFDRGALPVRVLTGPERHDFSSAALVAGALLLAAGAGHVLRPGATGPSTLDWAAGASTAAAAVHHAWHEVNERGYYDPEVLTLGYLATALARRSVFKPALVTWAATFGRHLLESSDESITVRPVARGAGPDGVQNYEVEVGRDRAQSLRAKALRVLRSFVEPDLGGGRSYGRRSLVDEMLDVSRSHGRVLDGMDWMPDGIPLRFNEEVF